MRWVGRFLGVHSALGLAAVGVATVGIGAAFAIGGSAGQPIREQFHQLVGDASVPLIVAIALVVCAVLVGGLWAGRALERLDARARWPGMIVEATLLIPGGLSSLAGGVCIALLIDGRAVLRPEHGRLRAETTHLHPAHPLGGRRYDLLAVVLALAAWVM